MKDDKVFLQNILECIVKIETYTNSGREEFIRSDLIQDAVIRNLEIAEKLQKEYHKESKNNIKRFHGGKWQDYAMC